MPSKLASHIKSLEFSTRVDREAGLVANSHS